MVDTPGSDDICSPTAATRASWSTPGARETRQQHRTGQGERRIAARARGEGQGRAGRRRTDGHDNGAVARVEVLAVLDNVVQGDVVDARGGDGHGAAKGRAAEGGAVKVVHQHWKNKESGGGGVRERPGQGEAIRQAAVWAPARPSLFRRGLQRSLLPAMSLASPATRALCFFTSQSKRFGPGSRRGERDETRETGTGWALLSKTRRGPCRPLCCRNALATVSATVLPM